ncbi:MAG: protein sip-5 [Luteimonas sp.]|nr:protein sip-5 [Luteimonas sp.]
MNFEALKRRVERAEQLVDGRIAKTGEHRARLGQAWQQAWTPGRIIVVGLVGGFLVARANPLRALGSVSTTRWVQLATSVSGLFASLKAAYAAETAEAAATEAEGAAETAGAVAEEAATVQAGAADAEAPARASVSDGRRRPDTQWDSAPRPAEAATEESER